MKGFKAFNKGLVCKNKKYAENTVFEEEQATICERGMHFCVNPFDVLDYYPLVNSDGEFSDFAEVESLAETKTDDNKMSHLLYVALTRSKDHLTILISQNVESTFSRDYVLAFFAQYSASVRQIQ